jgi:hypothetical protein
MALLFESGEIWCREPGPLPLYWPHVGAGTAYTSGEKRERGAKARLYVRWMPHLGAEAVALYELLRVLPDVGQDWIEVEELAELMRSTPENVENSLHTLIEYGFALERDGWVEVLERPPVASKVVELGGAGRGKRTLTCSRRGDRGGEGRARRGLAGRLFSLYGEPTGSAHPRVFERVL